MKKKLVSIFLTLAMALTMLPLSALAASWTVTLGGTEYTLTEDEEGNLTTEPSGNNYYTFSKVTDGEADNMFYYSFNGTQLGAIEGTPVAEATVEEDTITVPATVEDGRAEVSFTVDDSDLESLSADENGTVTIAASGIEAQDVSAVEVRLPENLIEAVQEDSTITSVKIDVTIATVALPAADLSADDHLTVTKVSASGTVLGGVSLTMGGGQFSAPVEVTIEVSAAASNHVVAYLNQGRYFRVRQNAQDNGAFTFFTRHFSDFVVVDGDVTVAVEMEDVGENGYHAYKVEQDETVVAAIMDSNGSVNYLRMGATAGQMGDELRTTGDFDFAADQIFNVAAVVGPADKNAQGVIDLGDPNTVVRVDSRFGGIL